MKKHFAAYGIGVLAGVFAMAFGLSLAVSAQSDITADRLEIIKSRCTNSQFALQQIQKRDAVSRINRGRSYDQLLRQVSAFNGRFAYNRINAPDLVQITADIQSAVDIFRANYDRYDTDLSDAQKIDCKQKPADYYITILRSRDDRKTVGDQVTRIAELMARYRATIVNYEGTVQ